MADYTLGYTGAQVNEAVAKFNANYIDPSDADADVSQVFPGATFYAGSGKVRKTGAMATKSAATYTPGNSDQTIAANVYLTGAQTIKAVQTETKSITTNGTYIPTSGKYFSSVTVNVSSGGSTTPTLQSKTVTPSESQQTVTADSGYGGLSSVTVNAISNTYVGSGVTKKAAATYTPGTSAQTIAAGQYLSGAQTIAAVQTETKTITANGTYKPSNGKFFSSITVNVPSSGGGSGGGGGSVYPDGAFAPVTTFTDGKQYALVALIGGVYRYINTTAYNNYTQTATTITIAEDAGDYVIFNTTPVLFTAVASGNGFLLQNGTNYLHGTTNNGTALRVGTTQAVWTVDASETGGFSSGKYNAKEDPNAVWLFSNTGGYDWSIKFETAGSFGFDRSGRDNTYSTGFTPFVLYEYVAGESAVSPIVDTSDANVMADKMLAGYSGYVKGKKVEGSIELQTKTVTSNGTVTPDSGKLLSSVVVNVPTGGSGGATVKTATATPTANSTSISFTGLTGQPKMFAITPTANVTLGTSNRLITNVMYDGTTTHGVFGFGAGSWNATYTATYSATDYSWTYSNGTLTVSTSGATTGGYFASGIAYKLVCCT